MAKQYLPEAEQYTKQNNLRQIWRKFVRVMACVVVFCTTYALILPAITMEKDPVCGLEAHTHAEGCYTQVTTVQTSTLSCTYESLGVHVHGEACLDTEGHPVCGLSDYVLHTHDDSCGDGCVLPEISGHVHADACYQAVEAEPELVCGLEEAEAHTHGADCHDAEGALVCELAETEGHAHGEGCWQTPETEPELICGREEAILHSHTEECYDAEDVLICTLPVLEQHIHGEGCFTVTEEAADTETLTCGQEESEAHTHTALCRGTWELVCELAEHAHAEECYPTEPVTEAPTQPSAVDQVISLIDEMPSADEIDAKIAEFDEAGDYEGEEAWLTEVYQQVAYVYSQYSALTEEEKAQVTNADKLLELEYIWSRVTLAVTTARPTIYQINSYDRSDGNFNGSSGSAVMLHGNGTVQSILGVPDNWIFEYWYAIFAAPVTEDGRIYYKVTKIIQPGENLLSCSPPENGYLLLFYRDQVIPTVSVGNYVTIHFTVPSSGAEKTEGYGTVSFSTAKSGIYSDAPTKINSASTSEFVEINLYDYNGNINANYWNEDKEWWYPGFQWNGGAYQKYGVTNSSADLGIPDYNADRHKIDSIDFGNSLITNLTRGEGTSTYYTKAINSTDVAKTSANYSGNSPINWIYGNSSEGWTNKPIGTSTTDIQYDPDVMYDTLINGYPAMSDETMLDYLFKDDTAKGTASAVRKLNTKSIDGLFQYDSTSGAYYFNSRENHAEYVSGENRFQLYDEIITPNFLLYPFGNFLPLNTIDDSSKATQVSAFNYSGGMRNYVERTIADLKNDAEGLGSYWYDTQRQLAIMLEEYQESWTIDGRTINETPNTWENVSAANAIRDYFWKDNNSTNNNSTGDGPTTNTDFITSDHLSHMYNIDWDVQTNFFFGMEMKMNFYQPKDGMTGTDTDKDGDFDYPMEFNFTGDDDVWVYIDGVLFLDLSGIHRHVGGKIDFVNGIVYYYELLPADTGDVKESSYVHFTFEQILTAAGKSTNGLNSKGTFKDYTTHTFNFYYMERGSGSSVCRLNFNFPLLRQNTLSVEKELTADEDIKALGNPDFKFQVLKVENGSKTQEQFLPGFWAYSLYDADGSVIQEIKVSSKYADGRVKEMTIEDGQGEVLCTETYKADGTLESRVGDRQNEVIRLGQNGIFTLKAGQRAEFVGIPESMGQYYVRELLDDTIDEQYGTITVSGVVTDRTSVEVGGTKFQGVESPILDMTNGSSSFKFSNKITTTKLGKLSITKNLDATYSGDTSKTFRFAVTLDGQPLPAGTTYTVGSATKEVVVEGGVSYVELKGGETAIISKILAGTRFEVTETAASAAGYVVTYNGNDATVTSATGTIGVEETVSVTVKNSERGASVQIPVTKGYYYHGTYQRVSYFNLVQVSDEKGMEAVGETVTKSIELTKEGDTCVDTTNNALFTLNYVEKEINFGDSEKLVLYYRLTEDNTQLPGSTLPNYQVFVYEVTVTKAQAGGSMDAAITGMWSGTADINGVPTGDLTKLDGTPTATFMNTIYGPLTVEKKVDGSDAYKQRVYEFEIILNTSNRGGAPLPDTLPAVITRIAEDGTKTPEDTTVTLTPKPDTGDNGQTRKSITVTLSHNESITINQIPYYATWSVTEQKVAEDVQVSYEIYKGPGLVESISQDKPVGYILVGENSVAKVVFTNKQIYVLPETGGPGTTSYAMAGLMLMLCSAAYLLYRHKKRGREVV